MKMLNNRNGFFPPLSMNYCRIFAKKRTLEMLAVSFWGLSTKSLL